MFLILTFHNFLKSKKDKPEFVKQSFNNNSPRTGIQYTMHIRGHIIVFLYFLVLVWRSFKHHIISVITVIQRTVYSAYGSC